MHGNNGGTMGNNYTVDDEPLDPIGSFTEARDALLRHGSVEPVVCIKPGWCIAGRPQTGRRIVTRSGGGVLYVESEFVAALVGELADREPEDFAWQYVDAPAEVSQGDVVQCLVVGLLARIGDQRDEDARRGRRARLLLGFFAASAMGGRRR